MYLCEGSRPLGTDILYLRYVVSANRSYCNCIEWGTVSVALVQSPWLGATSAGAGRDFAARRRPCSSTFSFRIYINISYLKHHNIGKLFVKSETRVGLKLFIVRIWCSCKVIVVMWTLFIFIYLIKCNRSHACAGRCPSGALQHESFRPLKIYPFKMVIK